MADEPRRSREAAVRGYTSDTAMQADLSSAAQRQADREARAVDMPDTGTMGQRRPRYRTPEEYQAAQVAPVNRSQGTVPGRSGAFETPSMGRRASEVLSSHVAEMQTRFPDVPPRVASRMGTMSYLGVGQKPIKGLAEGVARGTHIAGERGILHQADEAIRAAVGGLVTSRPGERGGGQQKVTDKTGSEGYKEALKKAGGKKGTRRRNRRAGDVGATSGQRVRVTQDGGSTGSESGEVESYNIRERMTPERMRAIQRAGGAGGVVMPDELMREIAGPMTSSRPESSRETAQKERLGRARAEGAEDRARATEQDERRRRLDAAYEANQKKKKGKG